MTATANINGNEIEIFVHEIICKDGDGVMVIDWGAKLYLVNTDMKKDYEWEWLERVD